jgi:serine/threonine protein kinase/Tol biopolymer transport system component
VDRETRLGLIAASILEGTPVDWPAVESSASPEDETVLRQLRLLEEVTALHRGLSSDRGTGTAKTATADDTHAPAMWGHLRLLGQVGRGSFGEVYRAWDTHLDREVALKLLRARPAAHDPSASLSDPARVVHEGRLLARVRHPHVITVYGAEPRDGTVGIWMEFIRGTTLHRLVEQQGRLGAREAAAIGTDLCRALAAVHRAGLLHRDISARNVMREEGGRVVLMDFGAGRDDRVEQTRGGGMTGTPLYMAPELFAGHAADQRSDIYALGTLLFYLVTGRYPVAGRSLEEVRAAHARGERTRLRDLRADVPAAFVRAIEQAVHPNPAERFQTAGEMEAALDKVAPAGDTAPPAIPRARWVAAAAAAVVGVGVVGVLSTRSPDDSGASGRQPGDPSTASPGLIARRIEPPDAVWPFSNPSDDGRFVAGMVTETGDAAIVDMTTGGYRALGVGSDIDKGYASLGALSPDGTTVAVDYHDDRGGSLHVVRTDGSRPRVLIEAPDDATPYEWSRDGRLILALVHRRDQPNVIGLVAASDGAVREIRQIGRSVPDRMSLSPDGRYIAYDAPTSTGDDNRDIFILDAHTGNQWPFESSPTDEHAPFWTPDGQGLVFLSDRNRNASLWQAPVENGRLQGTPRLLKDDVGRVWLRGFTAAGAMHYQLYAGYAEVYLASIDGPTPRAEPLSPRRAVSNFYPVWSPDGRFVAYASERSSLDAARAGRELWIYDATTATEVAVPVGEVIGRPIAWSADSREILVGGRRLLVVERATGRSRVIATEVEPPIAWGPAGVIFQRRGQLLLVDSGSGRTLRTLGPARELAVAPDGRSVISRRPDDRVVLNDLAAGATREWQDSGIEWLGKHFMAPHALGAAYVASRKSVNGEVFSLMFWGGAGDPRELLRTSGKEQFIPWGWMPDGLSLLVVRWTIAPASEPRASTLWRVPITGGPPVSTGLTMDGIRDITVHPGGQRIAFNAGWKRGEQWVMENFLPR